MRILVCASEAPLPPLNGFRLQLIPVCAQLAERHEVVVLAYRWPDQRGQPPPGVEMRTIDLPRPFAPRRALTWLRSSQPLGVATTAGPMAAAARELVQSREFDVLQVTGGSLAGLAPALDDLPATLTVFDANFLNYEAKAQAAPRILKPFYGREAIRVKKFEASAYRQFDSVVVVSDEDARALQELDPRISLTVVPNGVDAQHFHPNPRVERDRDLVVFTGAMHWAPNVNSAVFLAREILPILRERRPQARLAIVGRSPTREVRALAQIEGVEVTGEVPYIREWLWRASVFACPMSSGTGIKNKLLEAMACEAPSVATPLACQGLRVTSGEELLVAESASDLALSIATLLGEPERAHRLGTAGRRYVLAQHSWDAVGRAYERLLVGAVANAGRRTGAAAMSRPSS